MTDTTLLSDPYSELRPTSTPTSMTELLLAPHMRSDELDDETSTDDPCPFTAERQS